MYICAIVLWCCATLTSIKPFVKRRREESNKGIWDLREKRHKLKELKKALKKSSYFIEYTYVYSSAVRPSTHATRRIDYTLPSHWAAAAAARAGDGAGTEVVVHGGE